VLLTLTLLTFFSSCKQIKTTSPEPIQALLAANNLKPENLQIFLRAFKQEQEFECWAKAPAAISWTLLKTYPICQNSGTPGPKRREGDRQVPRELQPVYTYFEASRRLPQISILADGRYQLVPD
jgi:murein L,D-transpeptidase YafK